MQPFRPPLLGRHRGQVQSATFPIAPYQRVVSEDSKGQKAQKKHWKADLPGQQLGMLVERAKRGDVEAFQDLYGIYGERIFNYIYRLCGSREDAQDLTQDTFIQAFRKLGTLKENKKIQSWLYRIAQNNVYQKFRSKEPQTESLDQDDAQELSEAQNRTTPKKSPEESVLSLELEELIEEVIQSLPPKYRQVFVLAAIHKMSYQEISEIVNRSLASVKSDVHRARVVVRDQIKEYLGENYGMSHP